ncbi:MAG: tetratricopeptide repeat protein [Candidatus Kuenenia sp.]|nr:tetratricopeptide repeat protein [Candidatus Kuenenia hertensis]
MKVVYNFIIFIYIFLLISDATAYSAGSSSESRLYTIQVAHVTDLEEAKKRAKQLSQLIFLPIRVKKTMQDYFVILAGEAERRSDLTRFESVIRENGYSQAFIVNDSYGAVPAILEILPTQTNAKLAVSKNKPEKTNDSAPLYTIQVAHITNREEAKKRAKHLFRVAHLRTRIKEKDQYYILLAGRAGRRSDLLDDIGIIRENGYPQAVIIKSGRLESPEVLDDLPVTEVTKERQSNLLSLVQKTHYGADDSGVFETDDTLFHSTEGGTGYSGDDRCNEKNDTVVQAWDYYREKRFDEALELCDRMLFFDPFDIDILYLKLNILVHTQKYMEARMILVNIPEEKSTLKLLQLRADLEFWLENYDNAIALYQDLLRRWPENGDIWFGYLKTLSVAQEWPLLSKAIKEGIDKIEMSDDRLDFLVEMYLSLAETEKALCIWRGMEAASAHWNKTLFAIVNKLTADKKLEMAAQVLEEALEMDGTNGLVAGELALKYASLGIPEKGLETLRYIEKMPETKNIVNRAKAEIFSLIKNYETALSMLQTVEQDNHDNHRALLVELECCYGLEDYESLITKSSLLLQECNKEDSSLRSRVLVLRILSQIKVGLHREAEREIVLLNETKEDKYAAAILSVLLYAYEGVELLSALENTDYGSAVFSLSLFASSGQLEEHYKSIQVLGEVLKEPSSWSNTIQSQLLEDELLFDTSKVIALRMLHAWKIADELSGHNNANIMAQLAMAEYRAGNFQEALELYEQLCRKQENSDIYKLGAMECFLAMNNKSKAAEVCNEIQLLNLPWQEIPRYLENLVKLEIEREALYKIISELPEDLAKNTHIIATVAIANIQYGDYFLVNEMLAEYLLNNQSYISFFQVIMDQVGDLDKGLRGKYYRFVKNWLSNAVELYPENTSLQYQYARYLALHDEYELAKKQFLAMWEFNPNDTRVMRWMGRLHSRTQQFETSLKWYDLYVKTRPSDVFVYREREHVNHWVLCKKQSDMVYAMVCQFMPGDYNSCWEWQAKRSDLNANQQSVFLQDMFATHYQKRRHFPLTQLKQAAFYNDSDSERGTIYSGMFGNNYDDNGYSFDRNAGKWKRNQSFVFFVYNGESADSERGDSPYPLSMRINKYFAMGLPATMDPSLSFEEKLMDLKKIDSSIPDRFMVTLNESFEERLKNYIEEKILQYPGENEKGERFEIIRDNKMNAYFDLSLRCEKKGIQEGLNALPSYELKNVSTALGRIFLSSLLDEG